MLNDNEFMQRFSAELGEDYRLAKSYVRDVPTQTLLHVRSISHKLIQQIASSQQVTFNSPNLFDRIEQLHQAKLMDPRVARKFHKLRADGNRGAHPEKFHLTLTQLTELAEKSITDLLSIVETLYRDCAGEKAPQYRFVPFDSIAGRDLCYRAVMDADPEAQYLVGMSLKAKALLLQEQQHTLIEQEFELAPKFEGDKDLALLADESFAQAAYWFSTASERIPLAQFELGVCMLHGYGVAKQTEKAETLIAKSASQGVAEAMALLGYFYLVGSETLKQNRAQAEHFLTMAANQDVPEAMANLGVWFYEQEQWQSAYWWINKAAQAGYPHSQYHLALMLADGQGCVADGNASHKWMEEAASQGQVDAMLVVARECFDQHSSGTSELSLKDAEQYLQQAIKYDHNVPAMIELSIALADGVLGRIDVVGSAALLKMAKTRASDEEFAVISPLWVSLAQQIEQVIELTDSAKELAALHRAQELLQD